MPMVIMNWEYGRVNYEYKSQNDQGVTEICTCVLGSNSHNTRNNGPLRLNNVHEREHNAHIH